MGSYRFAFKTAAIGREGLKPFLTVSRTAGTVPVHIRLAFGNFPVPRS